MADPVPNERLQPHGSVMESTIRELIRREPGWVSEPVFLEKVEQHLDSQNYATPTEIRLRWMLLTTLRCDMRIEIDLSDTNPEHRRRFRSDPEWLARRAAEIITETTPHLASGFLSAEYVEPFARSVAQLFYEFDARRRYAVGGRESPELRNGMQTLHSVMNGIGWTETYVLSSEPPQKLPAPQPLPLLQVERVFLALRAIADDWHDRLIRLEPKAAEAISRAVSWLRGSIDRFFHIAFADYSATEKRDRVIDLRSEWARMGERLIAAGLDERSSVDFLGLRAAIDSMSAVAATQFKANDDEDYDRFNQALFGIVLAYRKLERVRYEPSPTPRLVNADDLAKRAEIVTWLSMQVDARHASGRPLKVPAQIMLRAISESPNAVPLLEQVKSVSTFLSEFGKHFPEQEHWFILRRSEGKHSLTFVPGRRILDA